MVPQKGLDAPQICFFKKEVIYPEVFPARDGMGCGLFYLAIFYVSSEVQNREISGPTNGRMLPKKIKKQCIPVECVPPAC